MIGITFFSGQSFGNLLNILLVTATAIVLLLLGVRVSDCFEEDLSGNADCVPKVSNK